LRPKSLKSEQPESHTIMSDNPELSHKHDFPSFEQTVKHGVPEQLLVLDCKLGVLAASKSFYTSFQVAPGEMVGSHALGS
jgi:hypothetical protein